MRISKLDVVKTMVWVLVVGSLSLITMGFAGCTTVPKQLPKKEVILIDDHVYVSCPRPTTVLSDYGVVSKEQLTKKSSVEIDALTLKAYGTTKEEHVACYKTLVNVKNAYEQLKLSIGK